MKSQICFVVGLAGALAVGACNDGFSARDDDGAAGTGNPSAGNTSAGGAGSLGGAGAGARGPLTAGAGGSLTAGRPGTGASGGHRPDEGGTGGSGGSGAHGGSGAAGGRAEQGDAGAEGGRGSPAAGAGQGGAAGANAHGGIAGESGGKAGWGGSGAAGRGGGSAGRGGGPATTSCASPLMLDDMEDGDALPCRNQGRQGDWWTATGTPAGTIDPPTSDDFPAFPLGSSSRTGSAYGMRLSGQNFGHAEADWASLGFNLIDEGVPYSLAPYQGVAFYAKSKVSGLLVHVEFATNTTTPVSEGGTCAADCNDHYASVVTLTTSWQQFSIAFVDLEQEGWGQKDKDLEHALFVYFGFLGTDGGFVDFDFLVDDVRLY